jgi:hypothetical protein
MSDEEITLPPLPRPDHAGPNGTGTYFSAWTETQVRDAQRAAVLLDRQRRAAPNAEPVGHLHSNGDFCWKRSIAPELWPVPLYEAPPAPSAEPVNPMLATPADKAVYQAIADNYFAAPSAEPVRINYAVLYDFAAEQNIDYNALGTAVRAALGRSDD